MPVTDALDLLQCAKCHTYYLPEIDGDQCGGCSIPAPMWENSDDKKLDDMLREYDRYCFSEMDLP